MIKKKMRLSLFPCEDAAPRKSTHMEGNWGSFCQLSLKKEAGVPSVKFHQKLSEKAKLFLAMRQHALTQSHSPWPKCLGGSLAYLLLRHLATPYSVGRISSLTKLMELRRGSRVRIPRNQSGLI